MKVVVTGHRGYIGTVLVPMLYDKGYEILGIDRGLYKDFEFPHEQPPIKEIFKDVRDISEEDIKGYDAIIHLAALSNDPLGELDKGFTEVINSKASERLAEMAKKVGIKRFVFSSSCSVYGRIEKDSAVTEEDPVGPITEYAKSKLYFENVLHRLADKDFTPVMMRNATVYGFSNSLRMDLVVHSLTAYGYFLGTINILSDGRPWRPLIHIQDVSKVFMTMLEAPIDKIHDQVFNVGFTEENYQIKEIAEIVKSVIPNTEITIAKKFDPDSRSYKVNFDKLKNTLNIKNDWNVKKGVEQLYEAFKKNIMTKEDFLNKKYARLSQLKEYRKKDESFFKYS